MKPAILFFTLFTFLLASPLSAMEPAAGVIKNVTGTATIGRGEQTIPAVEGLKIHAKDILQTGAKGSMGVIFRDDSTLSMGPDTRIIIDDFLFLPERVNSLLSQKFQRVRPLIFQTKSVNSPLGPRV